ncbi:MAG TPA: diaminopimelate epimerase [Bacteroidales bacterium]|nr:diaminopimelate epimerase [Bacteroidales bacterium]
MKVSFHKYHGTGNDFIIINCINNKFIEDEIIIKQMCDRHLGIGADGLILLHKSAQFDFEMKYFNSDGKLSSFCGNGGRCAVAFANKEKIASENVTFKACDGIHKAYVIKKGKNAYVQLELNKVNGILQNNDMYIINTGSPHAIIFVEKLNNLNVVKLGKSIRNSKQFKKEGINVNFAEIINKDLFLRTYERGVENETLSCGTGVTASALCAAKVYGLKTPVRVITKGGVLYVNFNYSPSNEIFTDIILEGPATFVFQGVYDI